MIGSAIFQVILMAISWLLITYSAIAEPCPDLTLNPSSINESYLEITSPEGTQKISLPKIMVFPEGKERIYCLLPDLLTTQKIPIIEWNELVLKKGLNSSDHWQGGIDRANFHPTPCLPQLKTAHFAKGVSSEDFNYTVQGNKVTLQGNISFAALEGVSIQLNLNIIEQIIPRPKINNLQGKLYGPSGEMEVISGEVSFKKNDDLLRGSGLASSPNGNQGFEFSIPNYKGQSGTFFVNEGNENYPSYSAYHIEGNPNQSLEILKYKVLAEHLDFKSFFNPSPYKIDSLDFNEMVLKAKLSSNSISLDPKPAPVLIPVSSDTYQEYQPNMIALHVPIGNKLIKPETWQEELTIKLNSFPIWNYEVKQISSDDDINKYVVSNNISSGSGKIKSNASLTLEQVKEINNGFSEIFQSFDNDHDTLQLKESILMLFSKNNLPTSASKKDDFEDFLITTVTEFRNKEKIALESPSHPINDFASNNRENSSYLLWLDKNKHFPIKRTFEYENTKIQIHYGDSITLIANNPIQGEQTYYLTDNPGLFDILQFHGALRSLPLVQGLKVNLGFFDLSVKSQIITINNKPIERKLIVPKVIQASINVEEEIMVKDQRAFKIYVKFEGLNNNLFVESLQKESSGHYYMSISKPHQLIKATYQEGIILEQ
ncbi:hypothetical protein [uncultured Cyclobacterium sp.]|uniref:hypothetical protein n=1 Tax=uncultured Cyclobacterium sp. TaxID=453820 RepID=UPI0030EE7EF8